MLPNDIDENSIIKNDAELLAILLSDFTTGKNILWATDNYKRRGYTYFPEQHIQINQITGKNNVIKPRIEKSKTEQTKRTRDNAEVFTPSWVCNKQNNLIDDAWFGYSNSFNVENDDNTWTPSEKVHFQNGKSWKEYVDDIRLEITCGESPYIVSRYDTVTGLQIPLNNRIGFFDRKMRVIKENATKEEFLEFTIRALKSVYGYEYQGDSLLIARENMLASFIEYYYDWYKELPTSDLLKEVANIISWNFWQMDGLKLVVPFTCHEDEFVQIDLFGESDKPEFCQGCVTGKPQLHNGKRCKIKDWKTNKTVRYIDLIKGFNNGIN